MNQTIATVALSTFLLLQGEAVAVQTSPQPTNEGDGETVLLDTEQGYWRSVITWKTAELIGANGEQKPLRERNPRRGVDRELPVVPVVASAWPPQDWTDVAFDDARWTRMIGAIGPRQSLRETLWQRGNAAEAALICGRGKFQVSDPAAANNVRIAIEYQGGCVVYVNGKELRRRHLPAGELTQETLAVAYPLEAYARPDGKLLTEGNSDELGFDSRDFADRFAMRMRRLEAAVPTEMLRKGVNVVAIAIHRAPIREVLVDGAWSKTTWRGVPGPWPHARLARVEVRAANGAGAVPNTARPAGWQVWQPHPWDMLVGVEYGDPCEEVQPIRLVGIRNGEFTGRFVVSSTNAIHGLTVGLRGLRREDGATIDAARVALQACAPLREYQGSRFDILSPGVPSTVEVENYGIRGRSSDKCAFLPVHATISVPADARPGEYRGEFTITADEIPEVKIPVVLQVHDWRLPDSSEYATRNNIWQSHDSLALTYKVPLWSDRHFELMGRSLEMTRPLANKFCAIHLIAPASDIGNAETCVRWIDKSGAPVSTEMQADWSPQGKYDYDFSVFDRYLDLYAAKVGKPDLLIIDVWAWGCDQMRNAEKQVALRTEGDMPLKVSLLDPKTGKVGRLMPPYHGTPESIAFWKPVLTEVRRRLERRGWMDSVCFGSGSDNRPLPETLRAFHEIWPDVPWFSTGHVKPTAYALGEGKPDVRVRVQEWVWGSGQLWDPDARPGAYPTPWGGREFSVAFSREGAGAAMLKQNFTLSDYRLVPERTLQSGLYGIGRVCADMWPIEGRPQRWLCGNPGQFNFLASITSFFHAGPDGPMLTARVQMFQEGIQVREALVYLQLAVKERKIAEPLAGKIQALLERRARNMFLPIETGHRDWQDDDARLYALCAETAAAGLEGGSSERTKN